MSQDNRPSTHNTEDEFYRYLQESIDKEIEHWMAKCECGKQAAEDMLGEHSDWCPKYNT